MTRGNALTHPSTWDDRGHEPATVPVEAARPHSVDSSPICRTSSSTLASSSTIPERSRQPAEPGRGTPPTQTNAPTLVGSITTRGGDVPRI